MEHTLSKLTREEQDLILGLPAAKNTEDLRLFLRYFKMLTDFLYLWLVYFVIQF